MTRTWTTNRREAATLADDDEPPTLAALYLRNREAMLRAAWAILRNQHDAEDAVSAAVLNISTRLANGHAMNDPDAYLVQSARNAALDQARKSSRRREQQLTTDGDEVRAPSGEPIADLQASTEDVVDQIIARERDADIQAAVHQTLRRPLSVRVELDTPRA
jgi:RNA polymerase sigma factor (sigma-70 family)